jgi:hypothetical protein
MAARHTGRARGGEAALEVAVMTPEMLDHESLHEGHAVPDQHSR